MKTRKQSLNARAISYFVTSCTSSNLTACCQSFPSTQDTRTTLTCVISDFSEHGLPFQCTKPEEKQLHKNWNIFCQVSMLNYTVEFCECWVPSLFLEILLIKEYKDHPTPISLIRKLCPFSYNFEFSIISHALTNSRLHYHKVWNLFI